jgi:outer membrane protein OmpA-like peptidoglycan-associated protein
MTGKRGWILGFVVPLTLASTPAMAQDMSADELRARIDAQIQTLDGPQNGDATRSIRINNSQDVNRPLYPQPKLPAPAATGPAPAAPAAMGKAPPAAAPIEFDTIQFALNSDRLTTDSLLTIGGIAEVLRNPKYERLTFLIVGHTDSLGSDAFNLDLSMRRACSVIEALVKTRVPAARLRAVGAGENEPRTGVQPESPLNRRVEIRVTR